jgi:hypothetical protein
VIDRTDEPSLTVPLSKVFKAKGAQTYQSKHQKLMKTNKSVKIIIDNDL